MCVSEATSLKKDKSQKWSKQSAVVYTISLAIFTINARTDTLQPHSCTGITDPRTGIARCSV